MSLHTALSVIYSLCVRYSWRHQPLITRLTRSRLKYESPHGPQRAELLVSLLGGERDPGPSVLVPCHQPTAPRAPAGLGPCPVYRKERRARGITRERLHGRGAEGTRYSACSLAGLQSRGYSQQRCTPGNAGRRNAGRLSVGGRVPGASQPGSATTCDSPRIQVCLGACPWHLIPSCHGH